MDFSKKTLKFPYACTTFPGHVNSCQFFLRGGLVMLDLMRRHARNWMMKVLLGIIVIVFVFYFGSVGNQERAETVATLDGKGIAYIDFQKEYENLLDAYRRTYGGSLTDEMIRKLNLKEQALSSLVNQAIVLQKAKQLQIDVPPEEVRAVILAYPAFQRDGVFSEQLYQRMLSMNKTTPEEFENIQQKMITAMKLQELIQDAVKVSDREVYDLYRIQNEKINLSFLQLDPRTYTAGVHPSADALESFLKERAAEFRVPDQYQVKMLSFLPEDFDDQVKISENDAEDYFGRTKSQWKKPDGKSADFADVRGKVIAEMKQTRAMILASQAAKKAHDTIYQEENFEGYATKNKLKMSEPGPFTLDRPPEALKTAKDLVKSLSTLQQNEMSRVLSSDRGYFLLKLLARKAAHVPPLKEIQKDVEKRYVEAEAFKLCRKDAESLIERLKKGEPWGAVAGAKGLAGETGFFVPGGAVPRIGHDQALSDALMPLSSGSPLAAQPVTVEGKIYLLRLKEREKLDDKEFMARKEMLKGILLNVKKNEYVTSWIENSKTALIKEGRLKYTRDVKSL